MSALEYWNSLWLELKITSAMSQPHSTLSSIAFFIRPFLRFVKVTCTRSARLRWRLSAAEGTQLSIAAQVHCRPELKRLNRTWRFLSSLIFSMRIFLRPTASTARDSMKKQVARQCTPAETAGQAPELGQAARDALRPSLCSPAHCRLSLLACLSQRLS